MLKRFLKRKVLLAAVALVVVTLVALGINPEIAEKAGELLEAIINSGVR